MVEYITMSQCDEDPNQLDFYEIFAISLKCYNDVQMYHNKYRIIYYQTQQII